MAELTDERKLILGYNGIISYIKENVGKNSQREILEFIERLRTQLAEVERKLKTQDEMMLLIQGKGENLMRGQMERIQLRNRAEEAERKLEAAELEQKRSDNVYVEFVTLLESRTENYGKQIEDQIRRKRKAHEILTRLINETKQRATVAEAGEAALRECLDEALKFVVDSHEAMSSSDLTTKIVDILSTPSPGAKIVEALEESQAKAKAYEDAAIEAFDFLEITEASRDHYSKLVECMKFENRAIAKAKAALGKE